MIEQMGGVQGNAVAFRASGDVTQDDFKSVVIPAVKELVKEYDELNFLMLIDTGVKSFSGGAWLQSILLGFKELTKWKRVAILTDKDALNWFTDVFSYLVPGEYKGFYPEQLPTAIEWIAGKEIQP